MDAIRSELATLLANVVEPVFLWGVDEDDQQEKTRRALILMATGYALAERARGARVFDDLRVREQDEDRVVARFVRAELSAEVHTI